MTVMDLVYFNAGGGHRAAALALEAVMGEQRRPWQVRLVNLFEVLDRRGVFQRLTGIAPEDLYNKRLARGWTLGMAQELKILQGMIRLAHPALVRSLAQHWAASEPDMVVSLVPNFNRALGASVAAALPGVPFVTVLTDLADYPPHFWIEPDQPQHVVCGTPCAAAQARALGCRDDRIHQVSGMILRPDFYRPADEDARQSRARYGLDPHAPTGVVLFGGAGSARMLTIAQALDDVQLVLMCGHNQGLADRLRKLQRRAPHAVVGYTTDVAHHLRLGDFFIGKPGPGSLSEALHVGLPVVTFRNAWTLPQERYNANWVREQGLGLVLRSVGELQPAIAHLLDKLPAFQARVRGLENRALFEVPEILDGLLRRASTPHDDRVPRLTHPA